MNDIFVLNKNLEIIGIVDAYKSLIWSNRYNTLGDCELYLEATTDALQLLQKDFYLMRDDDDMVCQIKKIQLDTDSENGNYLTVTGYDVKKILDQRIIWSTMSCDGNLETFIRSMVNKSLVNPNLSARKILSPNGTAIFQLGTAAGFTEVNTEQVSYKNVGEKIREYCKKYNWGYRVVLSGGKFLFQLYKGTDRTSEVIFSDNYENLATTSYIEDETNLGNVALVAGQGEGADRARNVSGYFEGLDRYEIYVDAKDIAKNITWGELTAIYPTKSQGGQGFIGGNASVGYYYRMDYINIQIIDPDQLSTLQKNYPDGELITIDGNQFYQIYDAVIADLPSNAPQDGDTVVLRNVVYSVYLLTRGYEKLAEYGSVTSFEGSIEPNTTFVYKQDYFLGDLVTVENEFGISVGARIVEVIEVNDDNGYSVEPKFEYIQED